MRFTALVVVGDGNGHVGAGLGKAAEIPEAIRKGKEDAMKKLIKVTLDENDSITHDYIGKFGSASVLLKKAPEGTGVIAGGPARAVIELAGIKNIRTKSLGSNNLQIDGRIDEVNSPYPIDKKFEAFNFHVINIDGHDFDQIAAAFKEARETKGMPTAIIAKTIKGKGVSFMEDQAGWHGKAPNDEEYKIAMEDLEKAGEALCQK